ncbi:prolactin-like [Fukomys damarensis]|uniref:prolactin-like n=1 Tax=Fukomys damarensis TaxID=885580 RepID=UPI00053FC997|nr:prolactin-like [Fukomys damarensis]
MNAWALSAVTSQPVLLWRSELSIFFITMDTKGKGSLLLLLVSSLLLCQKVASQSTCVPGDKCHLILQELYQRASSLSQSMYFEALDLLFKLTFTYLDHPGYFSPAKKMCHTADILTHDELEEAKLLPKEDIFKVVFQLVNSWNEALQEMVLEDNRPPKLYDILSTKDQIIYVKYQKLKKAIVQIGIQLDLEVSEEEVFGLSLGLKSLKSSNEGQHLFAIYKTLRCFVADVHKIKFLLSFLKCQTANEENC